MILQTKKIISLSIPSIIAIISIELMNVVIFQSSPIKENMLLLILWLLLQSLGGFIYASFSDKHYRKKILIISQIFGVIIGSSFFIFHMEIWSIFLIAIFYNPLPVARAAMLDNFPKISSLRILGITYIAQYIPWFLFDYILTFNFHRVILFILSLLLINIFITFFYFKDFYDKFDKKNHFSSLKIVLILTLIAFTLSETSFYIDWDVLEYTPIIRYWFTPTTFATVLGISIGMFYSRIPHISFITLCYFLGSGTMLVSIFIFLYFSSAHNAESLVIPMGYFAIVGGLYLPFVADTVIKMVGSKRKAFGSALIEFCAVIATGIAWFISYFTKNLILSILIILFILFLSAALLQKRSEKLQSQ